MEGTQDVDITDNGIHDSDTQHHTSWSKMSESGVRYPKVAREIVIKSRLNGTGVSVNRKFGKFGRLGTIGKGLRRIWT